MSLQWEVWEIEQYLSSSAVRAGIVQILLYNSIKMEYVWPIIFTTIIIFLCCMQCQIHFVLKITKDGSETKSFITNFYRK